MTDEDANLNWAKMAGYLPMPSRLEAKVEEGLTVAKLQAMNSQLEDWGKRARGAEWYLKEVQIPKVWRDPDRFAIDHESRDPTAFTTSNIKYSYSIPLDRWDMTMADTVYRTTGRKIVRGHIYGEDLKAACTRAWQASQADIERNLGQTLWGSVGT